jgi:hypothetical protein
MCCLYDPEPGVNVWFLEAAGAATLGGCLTRGAQGKAPAARYLSIKQVVCDLTGRHPCPLQVKLLVWLVLCRLVDEVDAAAVFDTLVRQL